MVELVDTLVLEASLRVRVRVSLWAPYKENILRNLKGKRIKEFGSTVVVEDGKFEKAIRQFKKKVEESGLLMDLRERQAYIKPTTKRKVAKNAAKKRWKKKLALQSMPPKMY
jgi:small subunit ribosomal protein S21